MRYGRSVKSDWTNAILIPIPKKGDLSSCDNWRGISLLDVVGKLIASILQRRLQVLAEEILTESQCGFRKGRSCSDMVFTMRQLVEMSWEHSAKLFVTFIDLQKAYDLVPRNALWMGLRKLGVPDSIVSLIGSFHQGMTATIQLDGEILKEINVENGLRQGCCMAPVLFNLYTCPLMEQWYARTVESDGIGIALRFKYDEKLFRRYTRNADERKLTECLFADDGALLATSQDGAQKAIKEYMAVSRSFGLTVSISKTKHMATGRALSNVEKAPISVGINETISVVEEFKYLGSVIGASGNMDGDIQNRLAQALRAFGALRKAVFQDKNLSLMTKRKIYQSCVLTVLLYGAESWIPLRRHVIKLNAFHHRCIRSILGITNRQQWVQSITSCDIRQRWGDLETIEDKLIKRRLEWLGHLARMSNKRIPKSALFGWLTQPRPRCGPKKRWRDAVSQDLKTISVGENNWYSEEINHERYGEHCIS